MGQLLLDERKDVAGVVLGVGQRVVAADRDQRGAAGVGDGGRLGPQRPVIEV
jgi:hypothetical protein